MESAMEVESIVSKHSSDIDSISDKMLEITKSVVLLKERERNMNDKEQDISSKIDTLTEKINDQSKILTKVEYRISQLEEKTTVASKIAESANKYWKLWALGLACLAFTYEAVRNDFTSNIVNGYRIDQLQNQRIYKQEQAEKTRHYRQEEKLKEEEIEQDQSTRQFGSSYKY